MDIGCPSENREYLIIDLRHIAFIKEMRLHDKIQGVLLKVIGLFRMLL